MPDEPRVVNRIEYMPKCSVSELVDWCIQRDLSPDDVRLTGGGHLNWESPETNEERDRRLNYEELRELRHAKWERETYAKLKAKFEGEDPDLMPMGGVG